MNITKLALKRPVSAIIIVAALVIFGAMAVLRSPLELTPDIELPMLITLTTYPGASPEDVEELVSKKVEDAVSTISGVKNIQSRSMENMSMVVLEMNTAQTWTLHTWICRKRSICTETPCRMTPMIR